VQSHGVSGLFMQCVDVSIALLGNLFADFLERARHFERLIRLRGLCVVS
jgi:hypothetical protein